MQLPTVGRRKEKVPRDYTTGIYRLHKEYSALKLHAGGWCPPTDGKNVAWCEKISGKERRIPAGFEIYFQQRRLHLREHYHIHVWINNRTAERARVNNPNTLARFLFSCRLVNFSDSQAKACNPSNLARLHKKTFEDKRKRLSLSGFSDMTKLILKTNINHQHSSWSILPYSSFACSWAATRQQK